MVPPRMRRTGGSLRLNVLLFGTGLVVVLLLVFVWRRLYFSNTTIQEPLLDRGQVQEMIRREFDSLSEQIAQLKREMRKGGSTSAMTTMTTSEEQAPIETRKDSLTPPSVYKVKNTAPLTVKTPLIPNEGLWLYPAAQRQLLSSDSKGPFHSQHGQDKLLYTGFFRNHLKGTFVELGAGDGTFLSNTRFFQQELGWDGVLIEPSDDFQKLKKGISGNTNFPKRCRPEGSAYCYNMAACQREGTVKMIRPRPEIDPTVSGAIDFLTDEHIKSFRLDRDSVFEIPCRPFGAIMRDAKVKHIDFLSLDVEGAEETVLETMDWSIPIHVIVIEAEEANSPTGPEGHERKHRILLENGFQFLQKIGFDEWWVNPKNSRVKSPA